MKECPFCSEKIQENDEKCLSCGEIFDINNRKYVEKIFTMYEYWLMNIYQDTYKIIEKDFAKNSVKVEMKYNPFSVIIFILGLIFGVLGGIGYALLYYRNKTRIIDVEFNIDGSVKNTSFNSESLKNKYNINCSIKDKSNVDIRIKRISFIFVLVGTILFYQPDGLEIFKVIYISLIAFLFGIGFSSLITYFLKNQKYDKYYEKNSYFGYFIGFLFLLFIFPVSYFNQQKEINNLTGLIEINENGVFDTSSIEKFKTETEQGQKIKEAFKFVSEKNLEVQQKIENYELLIYNDKVLLSYTSLENAIIDHQKLIDYITNYTNITLKNYVSEFKDMTGVNIEESNNFQETLSKTIELSEFRIDMYSKSKVLYEFYLENYDSIYFDSNGDIQIDASIFDEYELLHKNYQKSYEEFETKRKEFINELSLSKNN